MKNFLNYLEKNPFEGNQEQCGGGESYWNADMWTIEVTRCLLLGDDYTIPEKLKGNRFADPNRIKKDVEIKISEKKILEQIKDSTDVLLIGEVGRGLDILIANSVKEWDKIYCWDQVDYSEQLQIFDNVEFVKKPTSIFNPIQEKHIFIINHTINKIDKFKVAIHGIINGELIW